MKITQEADYAIRIMVYLAGASATTGTKVIAEATCVTQRFALKILRKLLLANLVSSLKGSSGGYFLSRKPDEVSLKDVINAVDGDIDINRCITPDEGCTRVDDKTTCRVHQALVGIKRLVDDELDKIKLSSLAD